jgi:hypothetical protein
MRAQLPVDLGVAREIRAEQDRVVAADRIAQPGRLLGGQAALARTGTRAL